MIVKNESKIITRLFDSVSDIIDSYLICDTGSTDNTPNIINDYFANKGIPGKVIVEPFKNFEYNRTFALKACEQIEADYILLLDADMILEKGLAFDVTHFKRQLLDADVHYLFQGSPRFMYKNVRIVKNNMGITYWGVTHEVIQTPDGTKYGQIDQSTLFINDVGDGGAKADKFERDIRLLTQGLVEKPNNDRYTFYLANSYRDYGDKEKAIEMYKKRIEIGGWFDEVWQSYYNIGRCYQSLGKPEQAIYWFLQGYDYFPKRLENIYEIIHYYRNQSKHKLAYEFYRMARKQLEGIDLKKLDYLFMQNDVYDWKLDYEFSITGYYWNPENIDMAALSMKVISAPTVEDSVLKNVVSNYKFYVPKLEKDDFKINIDRPSDIVKGFNTSTPSFCMHTGQLVVNVRYVDYYIDDAGNYINKEYITTHNVISMSDNSEPFVLGYNLDHDCRYKGLEDVRLFEHNGETYFTANRGLSDGTMRVEYGTIDYDAKRVLETKGFLKGSLLTKTDGIRNIEKNWVLYGNATREPYGSLGKNATREPYGFLDNRLKVVYQWAPFTTYDIGHNNMLINKCEDNEVPPFFEHLRGSTHGINVGKETWFICHLVSYEDRRYYYHILVAIDPATNKVKRWTKLFTLDGEKVEYVLGFINLDADTFLLGYSCMDNSTKFATVKKSVFDAMF